VQLANVRVSLGGDHGNTVPKDRATAAEIAVLRMIHGDEAVQEVEPIAGEVPTNHNAERARLERLYGKMVNGHEVLVSRIFPVGSRVTETLAELKIPEDFYKAIRRVVPVEFNAEAEAEKQYLAALRGEASVQAVQVVQEPVQAAPQTPPPSTVPGDHSDALVNALASLDPAEDAHWTKDGLPTVAIVTALLGRETSRAEINTVAPGFVRPAVQPVRGADDGREPYTGIEDMPEATPKSPFA
jgi:hypothetical protein